MAARVTLTGSMAHLRLWETNDRDDEHHRACSSSRPHLTRVTDASGAPRFVQLQARALDFIASNSAWSITPESSRSFARAISSAGLDGPAIDLM